MSQDNDNPKNGKSPAASTDRIVAMFEEGKRFTQELMEENERLRRLVAQQKGEIKDLTSQYVQVDVPYLKERIKLLEDQNRNYETELREIKQQYATIERENWGFSERYLDVERQNSSLLNHYVASQRLLSAWRFEDVLGIIKEIIINLIGSETFEICLLDTAGRLIPVDGEGVERRGDAMPLEGKVAQVLETGEAWTHDGATGGQRPVACVPLRLGERNVGLLCIHALLGHKSRFESVDHQLLELLGEHAAVALFSAHQNSSLVARQGDDAWPRLAAEIVEAMGADRS